MIYSKTNVNINSEREILEDISNGFELLLRKNDNKDIVFICIGTDRVIGDSYGPLLGTMLNNKIRRIDNVYCYGTLETPIHALNMRGSLTNIYEKHKKEKTIFIAVDACVTDNRNKIGQISIKSGSLRPGAGVGKSLGEVGDYSIKCIVSILNDENSFSFKEIRLSFVTKCCELTLKGFIKGYKNFNKNKNEFLKEIALG